MGHGMGESDADLVRRWQQGDLDAFEVLVRRWEQPVARFLAHLVGRGDLVEDLAQDVFLRVYRAGPRYREAGAFAPWLYRIALNVARDAGRKRRRQPEPLPDEEPAGKSVPAEAASEQQELASLVAQSLAGLPEPLREVLVLRHYEDMSFEQMARVLKVPATTLKSRFSVALTRMRVRLRQLARDFGDLDS